MTEQELTALAQDHAVDEPYFFFQALALGYLTLRAERDALKVQLETTKQALREFVEWHGGAHSEDCPEDDTCDCIGGAINAKVNAVLREVEP